MGGAATATRQDWLALVQKTLKDKSLESLTRRTPDGLTIAPLYTDEDAPEAAKLRFGPRDAERPWDLRTSTAHPSPDAANGEILADLDGGAASAIVRIDPSGQDGVALGSAEGLARVLDGVILELAPVGVDAGFLGVQAADWLATAGKASPTAQLMFHLDPLGAFAKAGRSPGPIEAHLIAGANAGARLSDPYPRASLFLASGRVVHEAGGGAADELGFMAASALAYAKALARAGISLEDAFARITLGLAADARYFKTIAKLRAARIIWERITGACGVEAPARIEARSSRRMLADQDVWTNMLRLTIAGFGAATGGADAVVLGAFTDPLGLPTAFARRQSRNAQLVLMEEAHVGAVADPARGAWFVEALTDQLARAGWAAFQAIEAAGGVVRALEAGQVAAERAAEPSPVGVTVFPNPDDAPPAVEAADAADFAVEAPSPRLPGPDSICPAVAP
ncbi:MAG TPA: methylmalonyl-CoA mutase family protein [Caulobacteraceae bacterium]|jgi:methylmalonyl-CoA mutase|nr:methylmalonyl-CoA mutase family protein [Caulobacteraceae bacterium]